ncbi:MAG: XisI protein [Saprospiraceae bacterium]
MDKIAHYRNVVRQVLQPFGAVHYAGSPSLQNQLIFDDENGHYLIMTVGWEGETPVRDCVFHIDITGGKIWIQEDNTDSDIASSLVEAGIPKSDIVLGFQSPAMRRFSSFGTA